ncbi:MAG: hypothetical protein AAFN30_01070 [Actinomycetota bacterium]
MSELLARLVDENTTIEVVADDAEAVRVKLGPDPHGVTLVGSLDHIHRVFAQIDLEVSRARFT